MSSGVHDGNSRSGKVFRRVGLGLLALAVLLLATRAVLPHLLLRKLNEQLHDPRRKDYTGRVRDLDLALWRGAYRVEGFRLDRIGGEVPVPFLSAERVDISLQWKALLRGRIVSEIELFRPRVNFVTAPSPRQSQTRLDKSWVEKAKDMAPFEINHIRIHDAEVHFRDFHRKPKVDVHLDHLEVEIANLTNAEKSPDPLPASFHAVGRAMDQGRLRVDLAIDPFAGAPTFDLDAELAGLRLTNLNDFFRAYANVDVEKGSFDLYVEIAAREGRFKGYAKPLAKDVQVLDLEKDDRNLLSLAWQALVGVVEDVLENRRSERVATVIPISGKFSDPHVGAWMAATLLLRNAFVRAIEPSLSHSIGFRDTAEGKPSRKK